MKSISQVVKAVPASGIRRFFDIVSQMDDVVSLGVGEPDFVTPWRISEAAIYSIEKGHTHYTSNYGLLELRELIAASLNERWNLEYNPEEQLLVTVGVSEALDLAMRAILNPGDEVLVPEPCYVSYSPCIIFAGGIPVPLPTTVETGFKVTPEQIETAITEKTKAILISYPSNPTGATASAEELQAIIDVCARHDLFVLSDEIYDRLTYNGMHTCVATLKGAYERTILMNGFSKAYAMTGWRVGYVAASKEIIELMMKIHQYTILCTPVTSQMAAVEALRSGESDSCEMVEEYDRRRKLIVGGLNSIGLDCPMPGGAFYAFPSIRSTGLTSQEFADRLLFEEKVAVVPGDAFGKCGEGYVRCSYATAIDRIEVALERIARFVKQLRNE